MNRKLFKDLIKSIKEMIKIRKGEKKSSKGYTYTGPVIKEGKFKNGGVNSPPTCPRPNPPKGKGGTLYKELVMRIVSRKPTTLVVGGIEIIPFYKNN